ncbi:dolichol-phosphate mannosyltransferase subunit 3 [Martensiomyces pterosporus]|nr:dolichol-phosphate mannosyltransferase subunit 3 [Martensiomyces pterosporus]
MTRAHQVGVTLAAAAAVWFLGLVGILPLPETVQSQVWPAVPFLALVSLGAYAFINIGYNLLVFRECPEAYHELMQEIQEAKDDLRSNGVDVA